MAVIKLDDELHRKVKKRIREGDSRFEFPSVKAFVDRAVYAFLNEKENVRKHKKKAQVAAEFLYVFGFALLIAVVLTVAAGARLEGLQSDRAFIMLKDIGQSVQTEITIASEVEPGYERTFFIPVDIDGKPYQIRIQGSSLIATLNELEYVLRVPPVNGNLNQSLNTIRNIGGKVYLN